jgi:all-trans-retinol 13,14-reductase
MSIQNSENFDIIFIGSGMGSLCTASLLAQYANKKILVLEKHFQPGGYTHDFQRKQGKYHWDVGIHYIGDMQEGGLCRQIMDKITKSSVKWHRMNEPFEKFVFPNRTFDLYGNEEQFRSDLILQFPEEKEAIERYFTDLKKMSAIFGKSIMMKFTTPSLDSFYTGSEEKKFLTVKDYMDNNFKNDDLKAILESQWGDYGLPPSKAFFGTHATLVNHYLKGGFYPVGGAGKIYDSVKPIIEEKGGKVISSIEVTEILIEGNKSIGVNAKYLRGEKEQVVFKAPIIVSCAGAYPTYTKLIPASYPIHFRNSLSNFYQREKMATSLCMYMGLSQDPSSFGFKGENYWIFASNDHDKNFENRNAWLDKEGEIPNLYFSFPSLKDPDAKNHTADVITFVDYDVFAKWKEQPWKKRDEEYNQLKERIAVRILDTIEKRFPGFKNIVDYYEISTPITNEHFTSHPDGAIYGLACVAERYDKTKSPWFEVKTPIDGLYLTGADAGGSPGIAGAMMGGLACAMTIMGNRELLKVILKGTV